MAFTSGGPLQITSTGFQFLLHSPHAQLWDLLLQYLHLAEVSPHHPSSPCASQRHYNLGKADGLGRSPRIPIYVVHHGARTGTSSSFHWHQ